MNVLESIAAMPDSSFVIQLFAVGLFAVCLYHGWSREGARAAQQWFLIGYLYSLLVLNLLVVIEQIAFASTMVTIGAAPSLTAMLVPGILYVAYVIAQTLSPVADLRRMAFLIFLLTPALMLPIDATGVSLGWWTYPSGSTVFLNGVPFYLPFAWGITGAVFYLMIGRIRQIRLRGNGQFFAMLIAAPFLAGLVIVLIAIVQLIDAGLNGLGGAIALYASLALLFVVLPLALLLRPLPSG